MTSSSERRAYATASATDASITSLERSRQQGLSVRVSPSLADHTGGNVNGFAIVESDFESGQKFFVAAIHLEQGTGVEHEGHGLPRMARPRRSSSSVKAPFSVCHSSISLRKPSAASRCHSGP